MPVSYLSNASSPGSYNTVTTSSHMIITQHVTWKRSDWNVRNQEPSPRKWSIYTRPFSSQEGGVWERDYVCVLVSCRSSKSTRCMGCLHLTTTYLPTVPFFAGLSRFLMLCPAVPLYLTFVPLSTVTDTG